MEITCVDKETVQEQQVVIRAAVILTKDSVRLHVISKECYETKKGNGAGRWYDFHNQGAREAFMKSGLARAKKKFAIPATIVAGSDVIVRLTVDWEKRFHHRAELLANWVMLA